MRIVTNENLELWVMILETIDDHDGESGALADETLLKPPNERFWIPAANVAQLQSFLAAGSERLAELFGNLAKQDRSAVERRTLRPSHTFCQSCGAALPSWFDPVQRLYDVSADDAAYQRWLDTQCQACGRTPRDAGAK